MTVSFNLLNLARDGSNVNPSDEGYSIMNYNIYYSLDGFVSQSTVQIGADEDQYVIRNLPNGTPVEVKVSATSNNGENVWFLLLLQILLEM